MTGMDQSFRHGGAVAGGGNRRASFVATRLARSERRRRGMTLVEVLVVIVIVAVLVGLLLPAVQSMREAARRTQCGNHLKQIGLAVQSHERNFRAYPGGGLPYAHPRTTIGGSPVTFDQQAWTWSYQILPFLEQQSLWEHPDDATVAATPVSHYFCPTRRPPTALKGGYWASHDALRAQIDYAGNAGTVNDEGDMGGTFGNGRDGVICRLGVAVRAPAQVRDGLSTTLLVGEKRINKSHCTTDQQPDDNDGYVGGFQDDVVRWGAMNTPWGNLVPAPDFSGARYDWNTIRPAIWQFGSSHPNGTPFVFCDGSVRTIDFVVNPQTFQRLCSIRDGEVADAGGL